MNTPRLRIGFAGTPKIARIILETLIKNRKYTIKVVFTQPDRPVGRGRRLTASEVKQCAVQHNIPVLQPNSSNDFIPDYLNECDLLLVVAYGMILPTSIMSKPKYGCINIHTSLLPRWRGAAPIQRAIESGDKETGITFMQMDTGLDTGPILTQITCPIDKEDTAGLLHDRLARIASQNIHVLLDKLISETLEPRLQDGALACYAHKITKQEAALDWNQSAIVLERKIRAFNPYPIAFCKLNNIKMRIWKARVKSATEIPPPGIILNGTKECIDVATSEQILSISKIQLPGKRIISVKDFLNGEPGFFTKEHLD